MNKEQFDEFNGEDNQHKAPPPPPEPPCRKISGYFGVLLNQDEIDQYEKDSAEWRKNLENWRKDNENSKKWLDC